MNRPNNALVTVHVNGRASCGRYCVVCVVIDLKRTLLRWELVGHGVCKCRGTSLHALLVAIAAAKGVSRTGLVTGRNSLLDGDNVTREADVLWEM